MSEAIIERLSDTEIAQMFSDYVTRMEDQERHTEAAVNEVYGFDTFCESEFPRNVRLQTNLYDRMMCCAVEFEESGFIAGFRAAMDLLSGQVTVLSAPRQITTPKAEKSQYEAISKPQDINETHKAPDFLGKVNYIEEPGVINTKQIADMFETTNFKVVRRIEKLILPYLDEETKSNFVKIEGYNVQHKKTTFYKMNKIACDMYLKEMEQKRKNFVNIAGGCAKLEELMQKMFPAELVTLPA